MKQTLIAFWSLIVLSLPTTVTAQVSSLVAGNTAFALNLYSQLATNASGNVFFSPYSISTFMAMVYAGAAGDTEAQMSQVLGFSTNLAQLAEAFGQLQTQVESDQDTNEVQLNIANALWTQIGFPFLPSFLATASNQYQATIGQADFTNATGDAAATQAINDWVAQETQNLITNLVPLGAITTNTRIVLANAIYFLGAWTTAFAETNTATEPFYLSTTNQVMAPLMHQPAASGNPPFGDSLNYMAGSNFQAIELPYDTNQLSMVILLPSQVNGLSQLAMQLSPAFLSNVLSQMSMTVVDLYLPRFTNESFFNLTTPLIQMGMSDAFVPPYFQGGADFSGMDGMEDLYLQFVLHKAFVQVNEAGTKAAAATGGGIVTNPGIGNNYPPVFRADHPFVYLIQDNRTGSILFMGQLANPTQNAGTPVPMPQLAISQSAGTVTLSWPYPPTDWTLLQNPDMTTTNWTPTGGVSYDGTNSFITLTPTGGNLFFRLSQQ
jgi:serpin B